MPTILLSTCRPLALAAAVALLATAPATAARLPLRHGGWVETVGAWRVDGERVIYRTPEGRLAALAVSEVDPVALSPARPATRPAPPQPLPVSPYPNGRPIAIPEPPGPPPPAVPRRPPGKPLPSGCRLSNPEPKEPPVFHCPSPPAPTLTGKE